jgi:hypothetical protein
MVPALDQGWRPALVPAAGSRDEPTLPEPYRPVSDVTRTVMLPLPSSGWRTK